MRPVGSKYLLEEPLGRGATGTVWRARVRDEAGGPGDQVVAIKVLKEELATDPDIVMRFLRERSALLRLVHPNIVRVRDLVVEGELLALVMDLVDGPDLHRYLSAQGPLSAVAGSLLMAQVADALATSHADGIVHRDLKPANVLLATLRSEDGTEQMHPLLTDFGIARLADSPGITRTHEFVGTPAYVAPESAEGREQTAAVDVYGAGIMLYELVTGRPPFHGDGPLQILQAHLSQEPERPRNLPEPLWTVIEACLRKDPTARPTAVTLATALRTVASGVGVHASPAAIDAAFAVGALLAPAAPAVDPRGATVPDGLRYDPAATTVLAGGSGPGEGSGQGSGLDGAGPEARTAFLPQTGRPGQTGQAGQTAQFAQTGQHGQFGSADPTQLLPPGAADPTRVQPAFQQAGQQTTRQPWVEPQDAPGQPEGPHPWQSQLRAARTRNEQTQIGYPAPAEPQQRSRPQVAPPPYRAAPGGYQDGGHQGGGYQDAGYQDAGYQADPYQPQPQHRPGQNGQGGQNGQTSQDARARGRSGAYPPQSPPPRARERAGGHIPERIAEPEPERAPRSAPPREPEPEPRPRREPRPARRRRMRIPGSGCLRTLLILAVIVAVIWYFTPVQHWIQNVEGWWHQVNHWFHSITGAAGSAANKIKNATPTLPSTPSLPSVGN
ncbi:protein kinase [Streptacidiphilus sp. PB12-B1b]|uniref:serine/threonine-protein kinase n=1 Tax=Streptacidiphilus sp. PB12-B1b TaxID=2705012 RepID=UPI0015FAE77B|nr:serine/threonine-protein kinase [Streptacidiphilus sp. PB12-B1b]QMU75331.1 protein kinase [Streptacidiphilus sp. PB12-B1b]